MEESKRALEELLSLLKCVQCEDLLQEPHIVGLCGHTVCRRCIGRRDACGVCGSPTTQRELKPDPQISSVLACAAKLGQLLSGSTLSETAPGGDGLQDAALTSDVSTEKGTKDAGQPDSPARSIPPKGAQVSTEKGVKDAGQPDSPARGIPPKGAQERSSSTGVSTRKVADRRNRLGETPLQVAAIKGDVTRVKALLGGGANPNVRDNAGWTPLHEASSQGALEVVRLLLAAGASVNAAGPDGVTPLHDAVLSNVPDVVLQLCSAGADINARTNDGHTPVSFAKSELMKAALQSPAAPKVQQLPQPPQLPQQTKEPGAVVLLASGLDESQGQALAQCAKLLGGSCTGTFSCQVSHLVVSCDKNGNCCQRTLKVLSAIAAGTWIVNFSWVEDCLKQGCHVDEALHEAQGVRQHPNNKAPQRARLSGGGTLFSGYSVVLHGSFTRGPSRDELATLLTLAGARLLSRVPSSNDCNQAVLVVADSTTASRAQAATFVDPAWLLDCISCFKITLPSSP
ncbi:BRCA1-associated RING domain protein 1 isoform X2 [Rhipicephalus microplus]|uniref:BRCA1-associated RING domain protein 1 isoform X2 n=1 Tax=Rhipicephalus microplus TaxID=6941 RepID=UPI0018887CEA|nr:BRCA1-associated RING domain protein 1-like isoform X2 [Rhipicephalus microplus]